MTRRGATIVALALLRLRPCARRRATDGDAGRTRAALRAPRRRLVIYLRHTSIDFGQNDEQMTGYEDCARQRNLTERGREEARSIGAEIKRLLGLPIGEVLASPFCRTMETARLMFGRAQASTAVRGGPARPEAPDRYAELRHLLSTPPPAGTNLVIASHGNPFVAVARPPYLAEGEAAVIRPLGTDGFRIVARIS